MASYQQAEEPVSRLINDFGPPVASPSASLQRAAMPFVHLERELWDLRDGTGRPIGPDALGSRCWCRGPASHLSTSSTSTGTPCRCSKAPTNVLLEGQRQYPESLPCVYLQVVRVMSQDRRVVNGTGSWKPWLRLILALGWLLLAATISFQRRAPKPPRHPDEPTWKLVVWLILSSPSFLPYGSCRPSSWADEASRPP
jgi:hypothetical protein